MKKDGNMRLITRIIYVSIMITVGICGRVWSQDLTLEGTEVRVTASPLDEFDPQISGNNVVYTQQNEDLDVWYTDLVTGQAYPVSAEPGDQQLTDISGNRIIYTDWPKTDVMVFDITAGQSTNLTETAASTSLDPSIDGDLAAWVDSRLGGLVIFAQNLATGETRQISDASLNNQSPDVHNGIIVWEACDSYVCDVYAYDWATNTVTRVTNTPAASERFPQVSRRTIVYERELDVLGKDLVAFNLDTGEEKVLVLPGNQENPHISGNFVSFNDTATGVPHVRLWSLETGLSYKVTQESSGQYLNDIDGNRIVYCDNRDGNLNIYLFTFQQPGPAIAVSPESLNFGDVEKGSSSFQLATIMNTGNADLTISSLSFASGSSSLFSITQGLPKTTLAPGESADLGITFAPSATGPVSDVLQIASNDSRGTYEVVLTGNGVYHELPPEQQIDDILAFFDKSVADGTLLGSGPGKSAGNRRHALRNMLEAAGDLIRRGDTYSAYQQLSDAYQKTDGQPEPPDFVTGPAAAELAQRILALMQSL